MSWLLFPGFLNLIFTQDIVDTTPYDDVGTLTDGALIKIMLGGINRRIDNQL